jgi:hypothetical protein
LGSGTQQTDRCRSAADDDTKGDYERAPFLGTLSPTAVAPARTGGDGMYGYHPAEYILIMQLLRSPALPGWLVKGKSC